MEFKKVLKLFIDIFVSHTPSPGLELRIKSAELRFWTESLRALPPERLPPA